MEFRVNLIRHTMLAWYSDLLTDRSLRVQTLENITRCGREGINAAIQAGIANILNSDGERIIVPGPNFNPSA